MSAANRSTLINRLVKALRKHYQPHKPTGERPLLEHLLYAALLEDSSYDAADEAFAALTDAFFDWNEVRVATINDLVEVIKSLPNPPAAAIRLRKTLQSIYDKTYTFDMEAVRKLGQSKAVKQLETYAGVTPFMTSYVTQAALGGHAIPVGGGEAGALLVLGIVNEKQAATFSVPGLERAVPKNKGVEFASLLHQLGAEFARNPYSPNLHKFLLEIDPTCKERLPKREKKKSEEDTPPAPKTAEPSPASEAASGKKGAKKAEAPAPPPAPTGKGKAAPPPAPAPTPEAAKGKGKGAKAAASPPPPPAPPPKKKSSKSKAKDDGEAPASAPEPAKASSGLARKKPR